ncbi:MAG: autotransporter domain-containing protein, partial [Alphaproteobacteria bacterium]|nr:autotransporter domain-containing protein [Alphaproteobacteria bacterium]
EQTVSGGAVHINGNVESSVALSNVTISLGNKLTIGASKVGTEFTNNGLIVLKAGTLGNTLSGEGAVQIDEDVTSNVALSNVTISLGNKLTIGASNIGANLTNNGTVSVTGGTLSNALSGSVSVAGTVLFGAGADLSGAQIDLTNGTLDIGENVLSVNTVTGGTVSLTLKETAESSALITAASANNVTVAPDMSRVSRKAVQHYILTSTDTGYSLILNNTGRYAVSKTPFEKSQAASMTHFDVSSWTGGDLYVMRISSVALIVYQDLIEAGYSLTPNETNAVSVMADDVTELLPAGYQGAVDIVNGRLETAVAERNYAQMLQAFREVGEEASPAVVQTVQSNAEAVMSVVANRLNDSAAAVSGTGRSGGDYTVGASSVWAQGMLNAAELNGTNGFKSDTAGFAAGFEYNINDSYKAGIGYAFSSTDIKTGRSKTSVDTHTGFVYGEYAPDAFFVNGVLSYGRSAYDEKTKMLGLKSDFKTDAFAVQMMSGNVLKDFTPEAGLRYINVRGKAYTNALGARTAGKNLQTWTAVSGVKTAKEFRLETGMLTAHGKAALTYDLRRGNPDRTVVLANGSSYVAQEEKVNRFGLEAGAGISYKLDGKTELSVSYEGRFKKHYVDHTGMLSIKYAF